jgi:methanogenic corrinoid protein MtbC1
MFLPDNEWHEMGLLFYSYIIRKSGHEVLYLGQATPLSALVEACEKWPPDILVTGTLSELSVFEPEEYLNTLSTTFKSQKILVSGFLTDKPAIKMYKNIYPIRSVSDLKKHFKQTSFRY